LWKCAPPLPIALARLLLYLCSTEESKPWTRRRNRMYVSLNALAKSRPHRRRLRKSRSVLRPKTNIARPANGVPRARRCVRTCRAKRTGNGKPPKDRRNPVELLLESNEGRVLELVPIRHGRMVQSPFAFFRGSAALMAADLAHTSNSGLRVQACGDAHLMNFGAFATPERNVVFDINDFDETLPAPWEWDLKRLAASVVIAGRYLRLSDNDSARAAIATVRSYREHIADYASMRALEVWYDRIDLERFLQQAPSEELRERIEQRVEKTRARTVPEHDYPKMVEHHGATPRIKDNPPLIFHPTTKLCAGNQNRVPGRDQVLPRVIARARTRAVRPLSLL